LAVVLAVLAGGWLWLRDSSLVAVKRVSVTGLSGPDATRIRSALVLAARNMTTLHVRVDALRTAVAPFPVVKDVRVDTQFPHGLRIRVIEQTPVAAVVVGGHTIAVAGDGTLLHDVTAVQNLAVIPLRVPPGGSRLTDRAALSSVGLLAAAPWQLLARVSQVTSMPQHGLVVQLRNGPNIYFGDSGRLNAKWIAAAAVLADAGSGGAEYIDVTDPERPAAGATSTGSGAGTGGGASAGSGAGAGSGASTGATTGSSTGASNGTGG
jgi:cell division protein FtsQ